MALYYTTIGGNNSQDCVENARNIILHTALAVNRLHFCFLRALPGSHISPVRISENEIAEVHLNEDIQDTRPRDGWTKSWPPFLECSDWISCDRWLLKKPEDQKASHSFVQLERVESWVYQPSKWQQGYRVAAVESLQVRDNHVYYRAHPRRERKLYATKVERNHL